MLLCGATSGLLAQSATYPFDMLRRKMQVRTTNPFVPTAGMQGVWNGFLDGGSEAMFLFVRERGGGGRTIETSWWMQMYGSLSSRAGQDH